MAVPCGQSNVAAGAMGMLVPQQQGCAACTPTHLLPASASGHPAHQHHCCKQCCGHCVDLRSGSKQQACNPFTSASVNRDDDGNFEWAVTSVISCIPLVSFIAWVMPAVSGSNSERANLYLLYSALYSAPLLRSGFDFDGYSLLMLGLCIAHVQAERIVQTEPGLLSKFPAVPSLARAVGPLLEQGTKNVQRLPGSTSQAWADAVRDDEQGARRQEPQLEEYDALALKEFDRKMLERDKTRRRGAEKKR